MPDEIDALFEKALSAGDLDALLALYEPAATFTVEPGKIVTGTDAIRDALSGFPALKPSIRLHPKVLGNAGDVALVSSSWVLEGTGPDGSPVALSGSSAEVVRRQADGR